MLSFCRKNIIFVMRKVNFKLRKYRAGDEVEMADVFRAAVDGCYAYYDEKQIAAWRDGVSCDVLKESSRNRCVVAEVDGKIVGFGNGEEGYLDMLCVHPSFQRAGIGSAICDRLEGARTLTYASEAALPFFVGRGYKVICRRQVERRGVALHNYAAEKTVGT